LAAGLAGAGGYFLVHWFDAPVALTVALVVAACWCSHIAADLCNRMPVAVLWPLRYRAHQLGLREGSVLERILEFGVAAGALIFCAWTVVGPLGLRLLR
ncbi:MAG: hypothetical protein ACRDL8_23385, partial [Solirubrobacteraceae bacterium]